MLVLFSCRTMAIFLCLFGCYVGVTNNNGFTIRIQWNNMINTTQYMTEVSYATDINNHDSSQDVFRHLHPKWTYSHKAFYGFDLIISKIWMQEIVVTWDSKNVKGDPQIFIFLADYLSILPKRILWFKKSCTFFQKYTWADGFWEVYTACFSKN